VGNPNAGSFHSLQRFSIILPSFSCNPAAALSFLGNAHHFLYGGNAPEDLLDAVPAQGDQTQLQRFLFDLE
jgi:hypothetical protein